MVDVVLRLLGIAPDGELGQNIREVEEERQKAQEVEKIRAEAAEKVVQRVRLGAEDAPRDLEEFMRRVDQRQELEMARRARKQAFGRHDLYSRGRNGSRDDSDVG